MQVTVLKVWNLHVIPWRNEPASQLAQWYFLTRTAPQANTTSVANPGPMLRYVTENPPRPNNADDIVITAAVTATAHPAVESAQRRAHAHLQNRG